MTSVEDWTIGRLLEWTSDYLRDQGSQSARLDAEVLLAKARNCTRIELYTAYKESADPQLRQQYRNLVQQRAKGMPVAYLVGEKEFYSLPFYVSPHVLIPRPETEFIVLRLLDLVRELPQGQDSVRIADLGTGSGILAVCAAKYVSKCQIVAVDQSQEALAVAQANVTRHEVADRVTLKRSDWFDGLSDEPLFDFVISNPPYVSQDELEQLEPDVRDFEPHMALVSGTDGASDTEKIIAQTPNHLAAGGWLILETSPMLASRFERQLKSSEAFDEVKVEIDLSRQPRILIARRK